MITQRSEPDPDQPRCHGLMIDGLPYTGTAATFWPRLVDEVLEDFPLCAQIDLCATSGDPLNRGFLFPQKKLEAAVQRMAGLNIRRAMRDTLAELDIMGPPAPLAFRLRSDDGGDMLSGQLPADCVDADLFPYLVVWPLEWAGLSPATWNNDSVCGQIEALDPARGYVYDFTFQLTNRHLSEGLSERCFSLAPRVTALA